MRQQYLVRLILVYKSRQPDNRENRRRAIADGRLQKREAGMAQRAAMIRRMMMAVFEGDGRELCKRKCTDHEYDE